MQKNPAGLKKTCKKVVTKVVKKVIPKKIELTKDELRSREIESAMDAYRSTFGF